MIYKQTLYNSLEKLKYMRFIILLFFFLVIPSVHATQGSDVIIVRSDIPYEFAIAQGYSHLTGIPIVITSPDNLSKVDVEILSGYIAEGYRYAVILGGEDAISLDVQRNLDKMGFITNRVAEADRYGTSAAFAGEYYVKSNAAVLVAGQELKNLLLAERLSSYLGIPLLFTKNKSVPPAVLEALVKLRVSKVYVFNNELSDTALKQLHQFKVTPVNVADMRSKNNESTIFYILAVFIGFIAGAGASYKYIGLKDRKGTVSITLLTDDEEKIVRAVEQDGGVITQDKLPKITDFSRPKITRLVSELEKRGIIEKTSKGRTNELKLKKEISQ
mgnify:CR=1 FL=1